MLTCAALVAASGLAGGAVWRLARRERAEAVEARARLLDAAAALFPAGRSTLAPDGFPALRAPHPNGGEIALDLVADTLVTRRLPQLWLRLTVRETAPARDFSIGALARPTGAEFYSLTQDLPDWIAPTTTDVPLLVRGRDVPAHAAAHHAAALAALFCDPHLKEAAATPRGVRIVRQAATGDRATHLLLRQARFPLRTVDPDVVRAALRDAERLSAILPASASALSRAA